MPAPYDQAAERPLDGEAKIRQNEAVANYRLHLA